MTAATENPDADRSSTFGSTPRRDQARSTITRTTITPGPGAERLDDLSGDERAAPTLLDRLRRPAHGKLSVALEPYPGNNVLRFIMATLLSVLCLLTVGGAILMLLLWQQNRASGVLSTQLDRTWDLFDILRDIERWVAYAAALAAVSWIALAVVNVRRATGIRRSPVIAALSLPVGLAGMWLVGERIVAGSDDWLGKASGLVLQAVFVAVPLLALERIATSAEARHRPLRVAAVIAVVYLASLQFLGGLSTVEETRESADWGKLGAYLIIGALLQVLGSLAANEAARSVEEGYANRYQLRQRFGESLLAQAEHR
jgi:hypothetical protein